MAEYDGSILIDTHIDSKEAEKGIEDLSKKIGILKKAQEEFLNAGGDAKSPVYQNYARSIEEYQKKLEELNKIAQISKEDPHLNQLKIDVEEYSKALKELESQGKYFGDEDYERVWKAWENAKYAVKEYKAELRQDTAEGQARAAEQAAKAAERKEAAERRAAEQADKNLQRETARIQKEAAAEAKQQAQEAQREAQLAAEAAEEERLESIRANATVSNERILDVLERRKQVMQELSDLEKAGVTYGYEEYDSRQQELAALNQEIKEYSSNVSKLPEQFDKTKNSAKKAFSAITEGSKKSNKSLGSSFKTILKYSLGIRSLFVLFNRLRGAVKEGFSNLAQYSDTTNKNISALMSSLTQLKNSLATAFAPILTVVTPLLTSLINMLSRAATYVGMLIAALTGQKTFTKATAVQEDYAASLKGTASAAKKAAGALAGFDDLDVLQKQEDSGGGGAGKNASDMFEEIAIPNKFQNLADKIKNILQGIFAPLKSAWESEGQYVMDSWEYALDEIRGLSQSIGSDFLEMWKQDETVQIFENLLHIIGDIGDIVGNLAHNFREAWEENDTGLHILENIRDIFGDIVRHIRNVADYTVTWSKELDFSPLLESISILLEALEPFVDNVGAGLEWFWNNVLLPISGWTIQEAVPAFLELLASGLGILNSVIAVIQPLGIWLWDNFLKPLGEWTGDAVIFAIEKITDLLSYFGDWISEHSGIIQDFLIILGSFAAAWGGVNLVLTAWNTIGVIAAAVSGGLSTALTILGGAIAFLTSPIGLVIAIIGALIAGFSMLYKHSETFREFINGIVEKAKEIIPGIIQGIKDGWNSLKDTVKNTAENIINKFCDVLGIHSPSTVMDANGVYLIEGLKNGISSSIGDVFALFSAGKWSEIGQNMLDGIAPSIESVKSLFITGFSGIFSGVYEQLTLFIETWNIMFSQWMINNQILYFGYDMWHELFGNFLLAYNDVSAEFAEEWQANMAAWWSEMVEPFFSLNQWTLFGMQMKTGIISGFKTIVSEIGGLLNKIISMFDAAFIQLQNAMNDLISQYNENASTMGTSKLNKVSYKAMGGIKVPALASGAVIRGGNPFLAMLGDQPRGQTNIEAPLSTIEKAVENAMSRGGYGSGISPTISLNIDGQEFARLTLSDILQEMGRQGYDVDVLGVT